MLKWYELQDFYQDILQHCKYCSTVDLIDLQIEIEKKSSTEFAPFTVTLEMYTWYLRLINPATTCFYSLPRLQVQNRHSDENTDITN